jgi:hypothetical protein
MKQQKAWSINNQRENMCQQIFHHMTDVPYIFFAAVSQEAVIVLATFC